MKPQNRTYAMPKATKAIPATTAIATRLSKTVRKVSLHSEDAYIITSLSLYVKGLNPKELVPGID
jgi:hypothetical protein